VVTQQADPARTTRRSHGCGTPGHATAAAAATRLRRNRYDADGALASKEIVHAVTSLDAERADAAGLPGSPAASGASNRCTGPPHRPGRGREHRIRPPGHGLAQTYQGKEAALSAQQKTVNQQEATLKQELGQVQASSISGDGVYVVGQDIKAGTWHTNGSGNTGANDCYFATLNSTNTNDIADNNNFDGPETVTLSGVYAFQISGPCTWVLVP
jgi:hypothetical protein